MRELLKQERALSAGSKETCRLQYYILAEDVGNAEGILCESYGVRVVLSGSGTVQSESMHNVTLRAATIERLVRTIAEHLVTPAELRDVVEDWIAAG